MNSKPNATPRSQARTSWLRVTTPGLSSSVPVASVIVGAIVLLFGRRLFWLCVAAVGFAAGVELAPQLVHEPTALLQVTIALVLGFIGALLALFLQKLAVGVVGFAIGGRLAVAIVAGTLAPSGGSSWLTFLIGGIIGAILLVSLFDWALIFLSAILGAYLMVSPFVRPSATANLAITGLALAGTMVQIGLRRRRSVALLVD